MSSTWMHYCTNERKWKINHAVSVLEPTTNAEYNDDFIMNVRVELVYCFDVIFNLFMAAVNDCQEEFTEKIHGFAMMLGVFYSDMIDAKDVKIEEILVLAESYLYASHTYFFGDATDVILAIPDLNKCIELLKGRELDPEFVLTAVSAYQQLGFVYDKLNNQKLSLLAHNKAFQIYVDYTKEGEMYPAPSYIPSYFGFRCVNSKDMLDKKSALSMQVLMKKYADLDIHTATDEEYLDKIVMCQHKILEKKLISLSSTADYCAWVIVAGSLCEYFITHNCFTEARDHLAAAILIIKKFHESVHVKIDEPKNSAAQTKSKIYDFSYLGKWKKSKSTLITRYWAKYAIKLLCLSEKKILNGAKYKLCMLCCDSKSLVCSAKEPNEFLIFANMKEDLEEFTIMITDKYLSSYTDATILFETVINYLNMTKEYYSFERHPTSYVSIMLNISQMYKYLTFYVNRYDKLKLHRQRLDVLLFVLEKMKFKSDAHVWQMLIETIISINDSLDAICGNFRLQSKQLKGLTAKSIKELSFEINEILSPCVEVIQNICLNLPDLKLPK